LSIWIGLVAIAYGPVRQASRQTTPARAWLPAI